MSAGSMVRLSDHPSVPASWASAGIVDARSFRVGESETVHDLSHASPNLVRGRCGVVARVVEWDGPLASWANSFPTCASCIGAKK